jgi:hypothetical protein
MVFCQVFFLSISQVQAVEISCSRKLKVGSKIRLVEVTENNMEEKS